MKLILFVTLAIIVISNYSCTPQHRDALLVGTYSVPDSKGIYYYDFNNKTGKTILKNTIQASNPSFLAVAKNNDFVYAVNENGGATGGSVSAFSFSKESGFQNINTQPSVGDHPCYVSLSHNGRWALVSNYSSGTLSLYEVKADGSLSEPKKTIVQKSVAADSAGDGKSHVHSGVFSQDDSQVFMCDLGRDEISIFPFIPESGELNEMRKEIITVKRGTGPRHLVLAENTNNLYVVGEKNASVLVFKLKPETKKYMLQQTEALVKQNGFANMGAADIHLHPNGKFLYASVRGETNKIFIFKVSPAGELKLIDSASTKGIGPRNFSIHPQGKFLLAANQRSNNIVVYKINSSTGSLSALPEEIDLPSPVSLQWAF